MFPLVSRYPCHLLEQKAPILKNRMANLCSHAAVQDLPVGGAQGRRLAIMHTLWLLDILPYLVNMALKEN